MSRSRRHPDQTPLDTRVRPALPEREVDTLSSLARKQGQRLSDLALLQALATYYEEFKPREDDEKWVEEEDAFAGMLKRLDAGDVPTLSKTQRQWALDVAARREVEWEPSSNAPAKPVPERFVVHTKFGRGQVVEERTDAEKKYLVDFGAEHGRKLLLARFVTAA